MNKLYCIILLILVACSYDALEYEPVSNIVVEDHKKYIQITPDDGQPQTCFVFYPGGLVEPESYITPLQELCNWDYQVIILKATADLAIFNVNRATKVIDDLPDIENWIIGGHSLGGVVAIKAIQNDPVLYSGLVLFASYPAEKDDLSDWSGAVLSISAENDSLSTSETINGGKHLLPEPIVVSKFEDIGNLPTLEQTLYYEIKGGNHAQFGNYGAQKDDGNAEISKDEQHQVIVDLIHTFFEVNNW